MKQRSEWKNHIVKWVKDNRKVQKMEGCHKLWLKHKVEFNIEMALGRDKFFDLMRDEGLLIRRKRKYVKTTNSEHGFKSMTIRSRISKLEDLTRYGYVI